MQSLTLRRSWRTEVVAWVPIFTMCQRSSRKRKKESGTEYVRKREVVIGEWEGKKCALIKM